MLNRSPEPTVESTLVRNVVAVAVVQAVCWSLAPMLTADAPPLDVVENGVWGAEHVIGTYKNPALSSLIQEAARLMTGAYDWPAYVLSQLAICITLTCVFLLGRDVLGPKRAAAGTVILTSCYFFGWNTPEFNQDIIEMPFWAATALCLWRATSTGRSVWWTALGAIAAGSLYGKLSAVVLLGAAALWFIYDARARASLRTPGPWLALLVFAIVIDPLAHWLYGDAFDAIKAYAIARGKSRSFGGLGWLSIQFAVMLPMAAVLWFSGLIGARSETGAVSWREHINDVPPASERYFRRYILFMTFAPMALTVLAVSLNHTGAKLMWGVPMANLSGLILVSMLVPEASTVALRRLRSISIGLILVVSCAQAAAIQFGPQFNTRVARQNWPQKEIASRMREIWEQATSGPLRIVGGDEENWVSGLVALHRGEVASVFTLGDFKLSPWITPERLEKEGMLAVWEEHGNGPPGSLGRWITKQSEHTETFLLRNPGPTKSITIGYAIIPPQPARQRQGAM